MKREVTERLLLIGALHFSRPYKISLSGHHVILILCTIPVIAIYIFVVSKSRARWKSCINGSKFQLKLKTISLHKFSCAVLCFSSDLVLYHTIVHKRIILNY